MRILIVGGGPGGLYLAQLLKRAKTSHEVTVVERNRADDTFGFGVVFSEGTLHTLAAADGPTFRALERVSVRWDPIEIRHRGETVLVHGNVFSAVPRATLLKILRDLASEAGADLRFQTEFDAFASLDPYDLVVAADGVNSAFRARFHDEVQAEERVGQARYAWYGSTKRFDSMTFIFEENDDGRFGVHAYPIDHRTSTFLVETDEVTWRKAGFDRTASSAAALAAIDAAAAAYLERLFERHLDGGSIITNNSNWRQFATVRCRTWHVGKVVLLGDAAHTAHFSVGSGTKMAMEDAAVLAGALQDAGTIEQALTAYEAARKPIVERAQRAAEPSQAWWERMQANVDRGPLELAMHFMTRTPRVSIENLRVRDPALVRRAESDWHERHPGAGGAEPLATNAVVGGLSLPNRLAVPVQDSDYAHGVAGSLSGAGLVLLDCTDGADAWRAAVAYIHAQTETRVAARVSASLPTSELAQAARGAADVGFDLFELLFSTLDEATIKEALVAVRDAWRGPVAARLPLSSDVDDPRAMDRYIQACRAARDGGAALVNVVVDRPTSDEVGEGAWRLVFASERVRAEVGVPTMVEGGIEGDDRANTAIITGRVDLCAGRPTLVSRRWTP